MKAQLTPEAKMSSSNKQALRDKLDKFYARVDDYTAFETVSNQQLCWVNVENEIRQRISNNKHTRIDILEVGAGRSGFGAFLTTKKLRETVYYIAQDVTTRNVTWLDSQTDKVIIDDVSTLNYPNGFDIIFSTYVFEHVTDPLLHLEKLYSLLRPKGSLFIFCPRYDVPGYFCPSSRHLHWTTRLVMGIKWGLAKVNVLVSQRPAFLIQTDLAAFHHPFFIDADAVHWVSMLDLRLWARTKGASLNSLRIGTPGKWSKDWIVKKWLTCAVQIQKL